MKRTKKLLMLFVAMTFCLCGCSSEKTERLFNMNPNQYGKIEMYLVEPGHQTESQCHEKIAGFPGFGEAYDPEMYALIFDLLNHFEYTHTDDYYWDLNRTTDAQKTVDREYLAHYSELYDDFHAEETIGIGIYCIYLKTAVEITQRDILIAAGDNGMSAAPGNSTTEIHRYYGNKDEYFLPLFEYMHQQMEKSDFE